MFNTRTIQKHFIAKVPLLAMVSLAFVSVSASAEDELFLATLSSDKVVKVQNISQRSGYDNQPHFTPDNQKLLYTAQFTLADGLQTDSMSYDLATHDTVNLTNSSASEYSPTVMPDGKHFSVIYVGADGRQRLSSYPLQGGKPSSLMTNLDKSFADIGYQVWLNKDELLLFVLGEPMQLQRVNLTSGSSEKVTINIGRTLRSVPHTALFSYNVANAERWQMKLYNPTNNESIASVTLPGTSLYYAWHANGQLLSGDGAKVLINNAKKIDADWSVWHDFSEYCAGDITRMSMSTDAKYYAFVCNTNSTN